MKNKTLIKISLTLLLLTTMILPTIYSNKVNAANTYLAITKLQTLDINYNIVQVQPGINITQVRAGNDVINEVEGWSSWQNITNASGTVIVGGLLVGTATIKNWTLPIGNINKQTKVCIQLRDSTGQMTLWNSNCEYVYWDTTAPTITSISLNNGSLWDNDWKLPMNIVMSDAVGVDTNAGVYMSEQGGAYVAVPGTTCVYNDATSKYDCILNAMYSATPNMPSRTFRIKYQDNLGNFLTSALYTINFAENPPVGTISIVQDASATNLVNITYSATDVAGIGGTSGIKLITIENVTTNPNNVNKETLFSATGTYPATTSGTRKCYTLLEKSGTVKMTIYNAAGSSIIIYSNTVVANRVGIESTVIDKVINPNKYPMTAPFVPVSVVGKTSLTNYPEAVTGGNVSVTQNFYWDTNVTAVTGFYQFIVSNSNGYIKYNTIQFSKSDLVINGTSASLHMQTMVDKNAPISTDSNITYVSLQIEMYVTINGVTNQVPLYFPAKDSYFKVAKVTGSIDDSINFEAK